MDRIIEIIVSLFLTINTIFSLVPDLAGRVKTYAPESDNVILNCAVVSDTHADSNPLRDRTNTLRKTYAGIRRCSRDIDVLLNVGDITNSGVKGDYATEKRLEKSYIKAHNTVACLGNHDSWNGSADPDYEKAVDNFLGYLENNGINSDKVYYSVVIKGYHFICLATEALDLHECTPVYSEEQLKWFDTELTEAEKSGLPIFVLSHRPLNGYNGISDSLLPGEVNEILHRHSSYGKPILFFSGHCHTFSPEIINRDGNIFSINLPSTEYNDETEYECNDKGGLGLSMEVYENSIVLRVRNYQTDKWIDVYRFEVNF